tara:strand:+ start:506 stop:955 length:450 start_codon:yes stop_codon:yes gene_type:complete
VNKSQFDEFFIKIIDEIKETRDDGQKEYAHDTVNVFANFERTARQLNTTREKILMTFLIKHIDGITAHINGHTSQREDVRGRIKDAIVYLSLLWGMAEGEANVKWEHEETEKFLTKNGFVDNKRNGKNPMEFNPKTGEVSYQSLGDEVI